MITQPKDKPQLALKIILNFNLPSLMVLRPPLSICGLCKNESFSDVYVCGVLRKNWHHGQVIVRQESVPVRLVVLQLHESRGEEF